MARVTVFDASVAVLEKMAVPLSVLPSESQCSGCPVTNCAETLWFEADGSEVTVSDASPLVTVPLLQTAPALHFTDTDDELCGEDEPQALNTTRNAADKAAATALRRGWDAVMGPSMALSNESENPLISGI